MSNYISADLKRIFHKKSFWIVSLISILLFGLIVFIEYKAKAPTVLFLMTLTSYLGFYSLVLGLFTFLSVYADDFKCHSMQIVIGYGMPRWKLIVAKTLECALLLLIFALVLGVLQFISPIVLGFELTGTDFLTIGINLLGEYICAVGYCAIASIVVFLFQNAMYGTIVYLLLAAKVISALMSMIVSQDFIVKYIGDTSKYLFTSLVDNFTSAVVEGNFNLDGILAILLYIIVPTLISMLCFKKKELDF